MLYEREIYRHSSRALAKVPRILLMMLAVLALSVGIYHAGVLVYTHETFARENNLASCLDSDELSPHVQGLFSEGRPLFVRALLPEEFQSFLPKFKEGQDQLYQQFKAEAETSSSQEERLIREQIAARIKSRRIISNTKCVLVSNTSADSTHVLSPSFLPLTLPEAKLNVQQVHVEMLFFAQNPKLQRLVGGQALVYNQLKFWGMKKLPNEFIIASDFFIERYSSATHSNWIASLLYTGIALFFVSALCVLAVHFCLQYVPALTAGLLSYCCREPDFFYHTVPWVGVYHIPGARKAGLKLAALLWTIIALNFCGYIVFGLVTDDLIAMLHKPAVDYQGSSIVTLVLGLESFSVLFARTRSTIVYYPKYIFLLLFCFCYYLDSSQLVFGKLAFDLLLHACISISLGFLTFIEKPALAWDQREMSTPSLLRPRARFLLCYNQAWNEQLPPWWTIFLPLSSPSAFLFQQLAEVQPEGYINV